MSMTKKSEMTEEIQLPEYLQSETRDHKKFETVVPKHLECHGYDKIYCKNINGIQFRPPAGTICINYNYGTLIKQ